MDKKTLILGASEKEDRYANRAARMLLNDGNSIIMVGNREGQIQGHPIITHFPKGEDIHTITLYLGGPRQIPYYDDIIQSGAKRIIFNPGTYNEKLIEMATKAGMHCEVACTLVMISTGQY
ncbi:MAG: CoA-binding protein [Cryomorphaceae bacterium]|nr:CoA-binding protein [Cryomorphaceae bacterium]